MKLTESRTIVELLEQRKMLDCDYPFAQYGESGEFDVVAGQTNDCVDVTLAAGDVLSVRFSIGKTTVDPNPNDPANTIVELKDIGGNKVIGSRHAFIGTTPCCFGL